MRSRQVCHRLCVDVGLGRWTYMIGSTCLVMGFVVEMICLGIIVVPYLRENQFSRAQCVFGSSRYVGSQFCQTVSDSDRSSFPCLIVRVRFAAIGGSKLAGEATLYLIYSYYAAATLNSKCTSRICYKNRELNTGQVSKLNNTVFNGGRNFTCYIRQEWQSSEYSALYTREFSESQVFHCILWPALVSGIGLLMMWIVFCIVGCQVWTNQISY